MGKIPLVVFAILIAAITVWRVNTNDAAAIPERHKLEQLSFNQLLKSYHGYSVEKSNVVDRIGVVPHISIYNMQDYHNLTLSASINITTPKNYVYNSESDVLYFWRTPQCDIDRTTIASFSGLLNRKGTLAFSECTIVLNQ